MRGKNRQGQILLITLLILVVAMTVTLSLLGRTTSDLNISTQFEESSRAFSAAEAGIEQELKLINNTGTSTDVNIGGFAVCDKITTALEGATVEYPSLISKGDVVTVWLINHENNSHELDFTSPRFTENVTLCWTDDNISGATTAIVATLY